MDQLGPLQTKLSTTGHELSICSYS